MITSPSLHRSQRLSQELCTRLQVRSKLQRALGRSVALEDVQAMTIAAIKALEGADEDAAPVVVADDSAPVTEVAAALLTKAAPLIEPSKIVDLSRDLPTSVPLKPIALIKACYDPAMREKQALSSPIRSINSTLGPSTPDRALSDKEVSACAAGLHAWTAVASVVGKCVTRSRLYIMLDQLVQQCGTAMTRYQICVDSVHNKHCETSLDHNDFMMLAALPLRARGTLFVLS